MPLLRIQVLGDFRLVEGDDSALTAINQSRQQALLVYLLLHRNAPQARQHLAFLLWPDSSEAQALTNLRKALTHLRQASSLLAQALYTDYKVIQWQPPFPVTFDVDEFEEKLAQATAAEQAGQHAETVRRLAAAVALYTGPLLPSGYDDWIIAERERLHQLCLKTLEQLVAIHERQRDFVKAIHYAQQLLRLDPLQESMYLQLMRLQALQGDRAGALHTYHTCATMLERDLGVEPGEETQAAYARLLKQDQSTPGKATVAGRVLGATAARLVGRKAEWAQLQAAWRLATQHRAHFVCVLGEAGIGKSYLAEEMLAWASQQGFAVARTRAYAGEGQLTYAPVVEWLRAEPVRATRQRVTKVWLSEVARLLPEILTEQPAVPAPAPMTERWQRQQLWEALARTLLAAPQPLLLLIDDLQWCDQETLEWLRYLLHFDPRARALVVGTARSEEIDETHPLQTLLRHLRSADQLTEFELSPLDAEQTAILAAQVAQQSLTPETQQALYRTTTGNPLFVVETVRAGLRDRRLAIEDQATVSSLQSPISNLPSLPPKVQAVIESRLVRLSPTARDLTHLAAVIGQAFTFDLLIQASSRHEDEIVNALDELWQRHIIIEQGAHTYDFSHDRIRDVAYAEVRPIRRRQLHHHVAQALEYLYTHQLGAMSGQLAVHYEQAGFLAKATTYYFQAAENARQLYASQEAIDYLTHSLTLLKQLPETLDSRQLELVMQVALGAGWMPIKGFNAPEVRQAYDRALVLCQKVEADPQLFRALWGMHEVYLYRADWEKSLRPAEQCLQIAQRSQDPNLLLEACHALWGSHFFFDQLPLALAYAEQGLDLYDRQHHQDLAFDYGAHDAGACALYLAGMSLWLLGYPDQARQRFAALVTLAGELVHPLAKADALMITARSYQCLRKPMAMQASAKASLQLCHEHGYSAFRAHGLIMEGWATAHMGMIEAGVALMQQGLADWQATGHTLSQIYFHVLLAEGYGLAGDTTTALATIAAGQAIAQQCDDRFYRAELYRLQGDLLLAQGEAPDKVENAYRQALEISCQRREKSLELRAATHLARLWQQQQRIAEAYQLLVEIYNWFTEGFDTADLQKAKALLEELSP